MHRLAPPLSTRTNLTVLNLSHNLICDDGADLLASAISNMSRFRPLFPAHLQMNGKGVAGAHTDHLAARLFHLDVGSNDIGDEGISSLFEALQNCQSLAMLELSFNDFGSDGLGLLTNTTLTTLDLSGNSIGSQAMERLQPLLSANSSLSHLDLGMCELESHGAEAVAKGLGRATSLRRLELPSNNIGDRGEATMRTPVTFSADARTGPACRGTDAGTDIHPRWLTRSTFPRVVALLFVPQPCVPRPL